MHAPQTFLSLPSKVELAEPVQAVRTPKSRLSCPLFTCASTRWCTVIRLQLKANSSCSPALAFCSPKLLCVHTSMQATWLFTKPPTCPNLPYGHPWYRYKTSCQIYIAKAKGLNEDWTLKFLNTNIAQKKIARVAYGPRHIA